MARRKRNDSDAPNTGEADTDQTPTEGKQDSILDLSSLNAGEVLVISRETPNWAKGYLGYLTVPDDGAIDIHEAIKAEFGGGLFNVRRKSRMHDGKLVYRKGSAYVQIAGAPRVNGEIQSDPNGAQTRSHNPGPGPIVIQQPAAQSSDFQSQLFGLVQQTLQRALSPGAPNGAAADVAGVIQALVPLIQGGAPRAEPADPFGQLERVLSLSARLAKLQQPAAVEREDNGNALGLGLGSGLESMLISKFLGGTPPTTPNPVPPPSMPQVPAGYVWHPQQGLIPWPPPQPAPQAPLFTGPPTPTPTHNNGQSSTVQNDSEGEFEPLTEEEIADDLANRSPEAIEALFKGVLERIAQKRPDLVSGIQAKEGVTLSPAPWMSVGVPPDA